MTTGDDWGRDPGVKAMRSLFAEMESGQNELLRHLGISSYDPRLRACRENARDLFERVLSRSAGDRGRGEGDAAALYIRCLIEVMKQCGFPVPAEASGNG